MIIMQDSQMLLMKNGELVPMEQDITMSNGTRVTADGMIMAPDGSTYTLCEGAGMTKSGRLIMPDEVNGL